MKHNFQSLALLIFLLAILISTSAREFAPKEGEVDEKISGKGLSVEKMGSTDSFDNLMGLEECEGEDEECLKRRAIAEAHLDYIYTQHHKP
ncbi:putative phytosulfokines 6 [Sesamum indicum]|uniref:Phytosulfokine n=1 Tax=Sesamum indicum TaxID=4182 RepID=A0A6I9U7Y5_SESIN|nr:putative phytosulfokines 6 [Sesamum indicum]